MEGWSKPRQGSPLGGADDNQRLVEGSSLSYASRHDDEAHMRSWEGGQLAGEGSPVLGKSQLWGDLVGETPKHLKNGIAQGREDREMSSSPIVISSSPFALSSTGASPTPLVLHASNPSSPTPVHRMHRELKPASPSEPTSTSRLTHPVALSPSGESGPGRPLHHNATAKQQREKLEQIFEQLDPYSTGMVRRGRI